MKQKQTREERKKGEDRQVIERAPKEGALENFNTNIGNAYSKAYDTARELEK